MKLSPSRLSPSFHFVCHGPHYRALLGDRLHTQLLQASLGLTSVWVCTCWDEALTKTSQGCQVSLPLSLGNTGECCHLWNCYIGKTLCLKGEIRPITQQNQFVYSVYILDLRECQTKNGTHVYQLLVRQDYNR